MLETNSCNDINSCFGGGKVDRSTINKENTYYIRLLII